MNFGMSFEEQMEHWRNALAIKEDREALINYFLAVAKNTAKKNTTTIDYEDLYSDLSIAVVEAIDEWKPSETYPYLSTYVNLKDNNRYRQIVEDYEKKQAFFKEDKQTEDFIFETNDKAISDFERTEDRIVAEQFWKLFKKYGSRLTAKERACIIMNYGFGGLEPMNYTQIGKIFGITKDRISQIVHKAERKLSDWPKTWNRFGRECGCKLEIEDIFEANDIT